MPAAHAGVLQDTDNARRALVARILQTEPPRRFLVIGRAGHLSGPGVRRVRQQCAKADDKPHVERSHNVEQFLAERAPSHVGLDASHEDQVEICAWWSAERHPGRRPGDSPAHAIDQGHRRPVDLEVVVRRQVRARSAGARPRGAPDVRQRPSRHLLRHSIPRTRPRGSRRAVVATRRTRRSCTQPTTHGTLLRRARCANAGTALGSLMGCR